MRAAIFVSALMAAGCAGTPDAPPPAAPTQYVNSSGKPVAQVQAVSPTGDVDTKRLVQARKAGYTVVNRDGETLFCSKDDVTGSHVRKQTNCLTAKQMDDQIEQTRMGMQSYMHANAPISHQ